LVGSPSQKHKKRMNLRVRSGGMAVHPPHTQKNCQQQEKILMNTHAFHAYFCKSHTPIHTQKGHIIFSPSFSFLFLPSSLARFSSVPPSRDRNITVAPLKKNSFALSHSLHFGAADTSWLGLTLTPRSALSAESSDESSRDMPSSSVISYLTKHSMHTDCGTIPIFIMM